MVKVPSILRSSQFGFNTKYLEQLFYKRIVLRSKNGVPFFNSLRLIDEAHSRMEFGEEVSGILKNREGKM